MLKRGIYNEFDEMVGTVEYDGNFYYNIYLYHQSMFDLLTPADFWAWMNKLDLGLGSL